MCNSIYMIYIKWRAFLYICAKKMFHCYYCSIVAQTGGNLAPSNDSTTKTEALFK